MEPINPSVWRRARRNTARRVSAVRIARGEYQGCPPGVVRGAARHPSMASSENHTVKLPRWRRLASYSRQFITFRFCLGIWWRRSWFNLNGKVGIRRSKKGRSSYVGPARSATGRIHATASHEQDRCGQHSGAHLLCRDIEVYRSAMPESIEQQQGVGPGETEI